MLKKVRILAFLNTGPSFHFWVDMAPTSYCAALMFAMFVLLCWYLQCCRATSHWATNRRQAGRRILEQIWEK